MGSLTLLHYIHWLPLFFCAINCNKYVAIKLTNYKPFPLKHKLEAGIEQLAPEHLRSVVNWRVLALLCRICGRHVLVSPRRENFSILLVELF